MNKDNLAEKNEGKIGGSASNSNILNIDELHVYGNDLRELTKLASINPKLAEKVVIKRIALINGSIRATGLPSLLA